MKKLLVILLALAMSAATLVGCGSSDNSGGGNPDTATDFEANLGGRDENVGTGNKGEDGKKEESPKEITASIDLNELDNYNPQGEPTAVDIRVVNESNQTIDGEHFRWK